MAASPVGHHSVSPEVRYVKYATYLTSLRPQTNTAQRSTLRRDQLTLSVDHGREHGSPVVIQNLLDRVPRRVPSRRCEPAARMLATVARSTSWSGAQCSTSAIRHERASPSQVSDPASPRRGWCGWSRTLSDSPPSLRINAYQLCETPLVLAVVATAPRHGVSGRGSPVERVVSG
jgi:hypothetical protein